MLSNSLPVVVRCERCGYGWQLWEKPKGKGLIDATQSAWNARADLSTTTDRTTAMNNQQNPLLEVPAEEANNYSRILAILGMEEEGDPVAEVRRLAAAEAEQQRAIDSALLTIADEYDKAECLTTCTSYAHDDLCPWVNTGNYIRSRVGTNPLAELQARNAELDQQLDKARWPRG